MNMKDMPNAGGAGSASAGCRERVTKIDGELKNLDSLLEELIKKDKELKEKLAFLEVECGQKEAKKFLFEMLFYNSVRTEIKTNFNGKKNELAEYLLGQIDEIYKKITKVCYGEHIVKLEKPIPMKPRMRERLLTTIAPGNEKKRKEINSLKDLQDALSDNSNKGDLEEFEKEAETILESFKAEKKAVLNELLSVTDKKKKLTDAKNKLERMRKTIICMEQLNALEEKANNLQAGGWAKISKCIKGQAPEEQVKTAKSEVEKLEVFVNEKREGEKRAEMARELLKKIMERGYPDLQHIAKARLDKLERTLTAQEISEAEKEALNLKNTCIMRNELRKNIRAGIEALKPKKEYVYKIAREMGVDPGWEREFWELEKKYNADFYKDEYLEKISQLQEEVEVFNKQLLALNRISIRHAELKDPLGAFKIILKKILVKRNGEGLEQLVRLLKSTVKYEEKIGAKNLAGFMAQIAGKIDKKEYKKVRELLSAYKTAEENKKESSADTIDLKINQAKKTLGLEHIQNYRIPMKLENLRNCIGPEGLDKLLKEGSFEHADVHSHSLLGAWPSLQSLRFKKRVIAKDRIKIVFEREDRKRLFDIIKLVELISQKQKLLSTEENEKKQGS